MKKQFDISIDHAMMIGAKAAFDTCLGAAVGKAISTGSDEGSATLRISFEIMTTIDTETVELKRMPVFKYKAGYSVPMKDSIDGIIVHKCRMYKDEDMEGFFNLVSDQVTMEEAMEDRT